MFDDMKEEIVRQVLGDVDVKITDAVHELRQNVKKALQCLHEQQVSSCFHFKGVLEMQMHDQQKFAQDIATLREQLDNSMQRSHALRPPLSYASPLSRGHSSLRLAPFLPNALDSIEEKDGDSLPNEARGASSPACELDSDGALEHGAFYTLPGSARQEASTSSHVPQSLHSSSQGTMEADGSVIAEVDANPRGVLQLDAVPSRCINLTIRRADGIPLGLDLIGHGRERFLMVRAINPGGAAEAWNRQCENGMREIRKGDRILAINEAQDANTMRREYSKRQLLKISLVRCPTVGLRADAAEFCPSQGCHASLDSDSEMCQFRL